MIMEHTDDEHIGFFLFVHVLDSKLVRWGWSNPHSSSCLSLCLAPGLVLRKAYWIELGKELLWFFFFLAFWDLLRELPKRLLCYAEADSMWVCEKRETERRGMVKLLKGKKIMSSQGWKITFSHLFFLLPIKGLSRKDQVRDWGFFHQRWVTKMSARDRRSRQHEGGSEGGAGGWWCLPQSAPSPARQALACLEVPSPRASSSFSQLSWTAGAVERQKCEEGRHEGRCWEQALQQWCRIIICFVSGFTSIMRLCLLTVYLPSINPVLLEATPSSWWASKILVCSLLLPSSASK